MPDEQSNLPVPPSLSSKVLEAPAEMVMQIALGMEEPRAIAARYGFNDVEFEQLEKWPQFVSVVAARRAELEASGYTVKATAQWMTLDSLRKAYTKVHGDVPFSQLMEFVKMCARLGDLEPKPSAVVPPGNGFNIQIIFQPNEPRPMIDVTPPKTLDQVPAMEPQPATT